MKLFCIFRADSDNCTYVTRTLDSIWTEEAKCLVALELLTKRYPEQKDYFWWEVEEIETDPWGPDNFPEKH